MNTNSTRRRFLEISGAAALAGGAGTHATFARGAQLPATRPKIAALASTYYYLSHAYHIVGRFLDGFVVHDGQGLHKPPFEIASLFIDQAAPATDLGRAHAGEHHVKIYPDDR